MTKFFSRLFGRANAADTDSFESHSADKEAVWKRPSAVSADGATTVDRHAILPADVEGARFPSFLASAIGRAVGRGEQPELLRARIALRDVFTPSQPVTDRENFAGRLDVLTELIDLIEGQRSHVVIYGERGIGKTSLLHILSSVARESQYIVVYDSCGAHSNFDEMFRGILRDIPLLYHSSISPTSAEAERGRTLADRLGDGPVDARQFGELCSQITGTRVMIVLDEYDRVEDPEFRRSVAELIKNLSDRAARVQLVISGVASNLQELVGYIPSIRRNVIGLPMPRLEPDEVRALLDLGQVAAGIRFQSETMEAIIALANGSPYIARLLGHHTSEVALDDRRFEVALADVPKAIGRIIREAESRAGRRSIEAAQIVAVGPYRDIAAAAARAASTPDGWFTVAQLAPLVPDHERSVVPMALDQLVEAGDVLTTDGQDRERRYRFCDEALPLYLQMLVARNSLLGAALEAQAGR